MPSPTTLCWHYYTWVRHKGILNSGLSLFTPFHLLVRLKPKHLWRRIRAHTTPLMSFSGHILSSCHAFCNSNVVSNNCVDRSEISIVKSGPPIGPQWSTSNSGSIKHSTISNNGKFAFAKEDILFNVLYRRRKTMKEKDIHYYHLITHIMNLEITLAMKILVIRR